MIRKTNNFSNSKHEDPEPGTVNTNVYQAISYEGEERFCGQIYGPGFSISVNSNIPANELVEQFEDKYPKIKSGHVPTMLVPDTILRIHVLQDDRDSIHLQACTCDATVEVKSEVPLSDVARVLYDSTPVNKSTDHKAFTDQKLNELVAAMSAVLDNIDTQYNKAKTKERQLRSQREYM